MPKYIVRNKLGFQRVLITRKGITKKKFERLYKAGKLRIRVIDVGRPKHHYVRVFYLGRKWTATTFGPYKRKKLKKRDLKLAKVKRK